MSHLHSCPACGTKWKHRMSNVMTSHFKKFCAMPYLSECKKCNLDGEREVEAIRMLKAMKGHKLGDGGIIAGFTITITDKKTNEKRVIDI